MTNPLIEPIAHADGLKPLIDACCSSAEVCLDTEADSLHHYHEKVCLLQFTLTSANGVASNFLVDTLAGLDLQPLFFVLKDKPLILHGSDYDLRMLKGDFGFTPCSIFDTMLAARLAGQAGLGLDALVGRYAGKQLDHGAQKADWSQRPLPPRLLSYAVEDTSHLPLIAAKLREELTALGRLEWHRQQCAQLIELCSVVRERNPDDVWRIKGSFNFDRQRLAVLRELWTWRDKEASEWDRPTYMVVNNDKLLELTEWVVAHPRGDLNQGPVLPKRWPPRRFRTLHEALQRAKVLPETEWPQPPPRTKRPPFNPHFTPRMTRLRAAREAVAQSLKLDPSILAPNAQLEMVVGLNPGNLDDFKAVDRWLPWQSDVLGRVFVDALQNEGVQGTGDKTPAAGNV